MDLAQVRWRKSSYSGTQTSCVEVGFAADTIGVRDTKNRDGGHLTVLHAHWVMFLAALRD